jgi:glutamate synthase domain-containing protein 2/glutamate synthase domain-containing protein 1/glutamate synthase domain-containing protein 3
MPSLPRQPAAPREEHAACGIGFLASRKGVAERALVEMALDLCRQFDHRGAPGHGAGLLLDIPWALLLDRFPEHSRVIAQRDAALGTFFLPFDARVRRHCVETIEDLAALCSADVLGWADVPFNVEALPPGSAARRTAPVVRQALFRRPPGLGEEGWFACRYLLRLALDEVLSVSAGSEFAVSSLSNRTVVYRGLAALSRIGDLYPDLRDEQVASRFVLFHSRYSTNTTTSWRRAQPFWALAHNGEIATIRGNVAWMHAIGGDLLRRLVARHPSLKRIAARVTSVICSGGSDSANLDDMLLALMAGGLTMAQGLLALLPEAPSMSRGEPALAAFHEAMAVLLGACDGPAAIVACDGSHAVAHLDRNGLRPLWVTTTRDYALASSELTGTVDLGPVEMRRVFGPGDTAIVSLGTGEVLLTEAVHRVLSRLPFPVPSGRTDGRALPPGGGPGGAAEIAADGNALRCLQRAFGMTRDDLEIVLQPLAETGKLPVGSMGDDTPPAALLDALPRRPEDYFALRFAQETSPPIDPIRDAWVFETSVALGDRSGLWNEARGPHYVFPHRILSTGELRWLAAQPQVRRVDLTVPSEGVEAGFEPAIARLVAEGLDAARDAAVLILSDRGVDAARVAVPALRVASRLHHAIVAAGLRHMVGLVVDTGAWDVHHCALLVALGADAVCPWLGCATAGARAATYLSGVRTGFLEAMSMTGVTPASAYCGAKLVEAVGLDPAYAAIEFPGVAVHLGGIGPRVLDAEWIAFHRAAFGESPSRGIGQPGTYHAVGAEAVDQPGGRRAVSAEAVGPSPADVRLPDVGEFRFRHGGRPHFHAPDTVRALHAVSGVAGRAQRGAGPGAVRAVVTATTARAAAAADARRAEAAAAYDTFRTAVAVREPVTILDLLRVKPGSPLPLDQVEHEAHILWRFLVPGMSEGALSEPAHRAIARAMNVVRRYCQWHFRRAGVTPPAGSGPLANSGEGGFDKGRIGGPEGNRSVQYAGARFTITPETAARAPEAEVKFAQGAKPGKGGQLPGRKVSRRVAQQRGCEPGFELVSPPVNHNLYSIEDVKLMVESWRHLNPAVWCALKYVATDGVELVCMGGVNAGANRLHLSDGCGGTGAAKRVDQKHAGVPVAAVLPAVHDLLLEEGVRDHVEISVDGGIQTGEQVVKLALLGADRFGFGTSVLIALGCAMLRQCHLAGPHPADPAGIRRIGCTTGVATQDPALVARFAGRASHVVRYLRAVARDVREQLACAGVRQLGDVVGRRDLLERRPGLAGKAAALDVAHLVSAPPARVSHRRLLRQSQLHLPPARVREDEAAARAMAGEAVEVRQRLTNADRAVGVGAAGEIARRFGDGGLPAGRLRLHHRGAAGHFYAAYAVDGLEFDLRGVVADSCFTAAYGGLLVIAPDADEPAGLAVAGNTFAYGARGGRAYVAGTAGNRFGVCLRKNHEGGGPRLVVEGVAANAFQYMTGGMALVLGPAGFNLGAGMTGGRVYLLDHDPAMLNTDYVAATPLDVDDEALVRALLDEQVAHTGSLVARGLLAAFDPARFVRVATRLLAEPVA